MRNLLIMRGIPASGKSSLIKSSGLARECLSADTLRDMYSSIAQKTDGYYGRTNKHDPLVFDTLYKMLENRMRLGCTTIIDATHCSSEKTAKQQFSTYKALAKRYGYRLWYLDVDTPVKNALIRNRVRGIDKVPEHVIQKMHNVFINMKMPKEFTAVKDIDEFWYMDMPVNEYLKTDLSKQYKRVIVVGDIHSCATVLKELLRDFNEDTLYVFTGDYFDRGIEHINALNTMLWLSKKKNVVLLQGNHEIHWIDYAHDQPREDIGYKRFESITLKQWKEKWKDEKQLKKELRVLYRKLLPVYFFRFGHDKYCVNHGGVTDFVPTMMANEFINGVGTYSDDIGNLWNCSNEIIQIHGHRKATTNDYNICLESEVEFGGHLSFVVIDENGRYVKQLKNWIYDVDFRLHNYQFLKEIGAHVVKTQDERINAMANSKDIQVKKCEPDLLSLNFTKKVFHKALWNNLTVKARGLFVDKDTGVVKARSYNKFFNLGERDNIDYELASMEYPVRVCKKHNGFLGIVSWNSDNQRLIFASKSTTSSAHAMWLRYNWNLISQKTRNSIVDILKNNSCSAVFEVVHPSDEHIIDYNGRYVLYLLDFIENTLDIDGKCVDLKFSEYNKSLVEYDVHRHMEIVSSINVDSCYELKSLLLDVNKEHTEGVVITDQQGQMYKYKAKYYLKWKRLRTLLGLYLDGKPYEVLDKDDEVFLSFVKDKGIDKNTRFLGIKRALWINQDKYPLSITKNNKNC